MGIMIYIMLLIYVIHKQREKVRKKYSLEPRPISYTKDSLLIHPKSRL